MWDPSLRQAQVGGGVALIVWLFLTISAGLLANTCFPAFRAVAEHHDFPDGVLAARVVWLIGSVVVSTWLGCLAAGESQIKPSAAMVCLGMGFLGEHRDLEVWPTWYLCVYYVTLPVAAVLGGHLMRSSDSD